MGGININGTASASVTFLAVSCDIPKSIMNSGMLFFAIVAECDNRPRFSNGGNYGQRTFRSPTSDQIAFGSPVGRRDLPVARSFPEVVSPLVASLSKPGPQRAVRSNAIQPTTSKDLARTRTDERGHSPQAGFPDASRHTRQSHWGQFDLAELQVLHIRPVPSARTVERVLERNGETVPQVRLAPYLARSTYLKPQANYSNPLHQVDAVGPIYLKGHRQRYYIFTCKDVYDGATCLKLGRSRKIEAVLEFLGESWKTLGRPKQMQFDNAREYLGWVPAARYLSRLIRLCLRFEVEPILIPPGRPQRKDYDSYCTSIVRSGATFA